MSRVLDLADRSWPLLRRAMGLHTVLYRATGGVIGHTGPGLPTMLLLDHVGARSGTKRTAPLLYVRDGDTVAVIASKGGYPKHPAWFHNLKANPDTTVQVGRERYAVRAHVAEGAEREKFWRKAVEMYPTYTEYQARSKGREIPVVVLERR